MKFILIVLTLANSPQYAVGPFPSMDACQHHPINVEAKRLCLPFTSAKG